jgi:hypothetical protein
MEHRRILILESKGTVFNLKQRNNGKIGFFNCCYTVRFDKVQNSFHQQMHPLLNIQNIKTYN